MVGYFCTLGRPNAARVVVLRLLAEWMDAAGRPKQDRGTRSVAPESCSRLSHNLFLDVNAYTTRLKLSMPMTKSRAFGKVHP